MDNEKNVNTSLLPSFSWVATCDKFSNKDLFTYKNEDYVIQALTGKDLADRIKGLGSILQQKISSQERVIIILPQGMEYIYSVLACFYANVVAIPISITNTEKIEKTLEKISHILDDSKASLIISDTNLIEYLQLNQVYDFISIINVEEINLSDVKIEEQRLYEPYDMAILLYTSGSTSQPKGVMLSHSNTISQALEGAAQWGMTENSRIVSWMPQFHNFGLYLNILSPLIKGASSVILAPSHFVREPKIWFETINEYHATHTGAPNFAFDLCYSTIELDDVKKSSLNSLEVIVCGGEPIRKETYALFYEKFKSLGLRKNVFCPHYGMSEVGSITTKKSSQAISFKSLYLPSLQQRKVKFTNQKDKCKAVVSCGEIGENTKIAIVNPDNCEPCLPDEIGEIWVKSPSVALGYLNAAEEVMNNFFGTLSDDGEGGFFRTGDLGFVVNNQLYVVGRQKEVIIVHGKKHYAVDIEWTIKNNIPLLTLPISVFSYETDFREKVVVIQEMDNLESEESFRNICREILTTVSVNHSLELDEINFVNKGSIPRTGSGKILRNACRSLYLNKGLEYIYQYKYEQSPFAIKNEASNKYTDNDICRILKTEVFLQVLQVSEEQLNTVTLFSEFGLNSIQYIRISKQIEDIFHITFVPVHLFKYQNIEQLANFIRSQLDKSKELSLSNQKSDNNCESDLNDFNEKDIAIIGMSCNFPGGAEDTETFWNNMIQNKDCITSIEHSRKQIIKDFKESYKDLDEDFPQFGGFIDDMETFDAQFFSISPLEAECMDPQQRKVMELTWSVIESSGYNPCSLAGEDVGLFMGVHSNDYSELIARQPELMDFYGAYLDSGLHMSLITHRVSRWFNFHGPSEVINTACSSSLVAIHHAIESIYTKESSIAIAGGVNLISAARIFIASHKAGMLSKDGKCKTFDQEADGFVRSEGYGAVLLKPYSKAIEDNDNILGIIKASAINHDGHSNSLRAPNFNAQKNLFKSIYNRPDMDPKTISYIETHGTGTPIGDPIEVQALEEAFLELNPELTNASCGLGSVKTNIGHCESASGIASLIKVILSMQHKTLPGILHYKKLNPYIHMDNSPFYIVEKEKKWDRLKKEDGSEYARRAGISSFGFGGANAHIVVEESTTENQGMVQYRYGNRDGKNIIPISAKDEQSLKDYVRKLCTFFRNLPSKSNDKNDNEDRSLTNIAFTLQEGREAMEARVVFLVSNIEELIEKMDLYLNDTIHIKDCFKGNVNNKEDIKELLGELEDSPKIVKTWFNEEELEKIAQYWVHGGSIDWKIQYLEQPKRMYLPTYPFAKTYYWIHDIEHGYNKNFENTSVMGIHPLVQKNTSNFMKQKFTSIFTGREPFIAEHIVKGSLVMPGAALIEMACAAIQESFDVTIGNNVGLQFNNIVWAKPIIIDNEPIQTDISLNIEENQEISFEIYSTNDSEVAVHGQGDAILITGNEIETQNITALLSECDKRTIYSEECYHSFKEKGITYGSIHQGIKELHIGDGLVLAKLTLNDANAFNEYLLHPAILDSAFQSTTGLTSDSDFLNTSSDTLIPFAIDQLEVYGKYSSNMWAVTRYSKDNQDREGIHKFDIDLCDDMGNICVHMIGFTLRPMKEESRSGNSIDEVGLVTLHTDWKEKIIESSGFVYHYSNHYVVLCELTGILSENIESSMNGVDCIALNSEEYGMDTRFRYYLVELFKRIQTIMNDTSKGETLIQIVFPKDQYLFWGLTALLRTAHIENPKIIGQVIGIESGETIEHIVQKVRDNSNQNSDNQIKYADGRRLVSSILESSNHKNGTIKIKDKGIYLITGGLGGIGFMFAKEIINSTKNVTLILSGRSKLDSSKQKKIQELTINGAHIVYQPLDVSDKQAVCKIMTKIKAEFGDINGIIHSAGVTRDNFIIKKSIDEINEVLAPKVSGVVNLDEESKDMQLDFFVSFSSIAGVMGNIGQADYAAANAFMDAFAEYRNEMEKSGTRKGKTISISWPLWKDGGMYVDEVTEKIMLENIGMLPMNSSIGISAFYQALDSAYPQEIVVYGNIKQIKSVLLGSSIEGNLEEVALTLEESNGTVTMDEGSFKEKAKEYLKSLLSSVIRLPANQINAIEPMEKYGIDSVMVVQLTNKLEKTFGPLSKTLFFEYKSISDLAGYFTESYREKLMKLLSIEEKPVESSAKDIGRKERPLKVKPNQRKDRLVIPTINASAEQRENHDIAIIGIAGRYPGANNINEFWNVLRNGLDCITEIPKERWDHSIYFNADKNMKGKTYSKWGGFIDDVDKFDPLFFNISPNEAELMDPQERLFLQCSYEAMEDAGYTREVLEKYNNRESDEKVGVFAGVMFDEYQLYGAQETLNGNPIAFAGTTASIANRVSYFYNLNGPSMTVNTMCSSSLTAIHLACQSIQCGECSLAFAGGVNVSIHPNKYLLLAQGKFASSKGRCESFGQGGDGYVPGEGVGIVLLKPLSKAIKENDHIYGVIKATSINHDGKTNGFTVPNPIAQGKVILKALKKAEVDPRTISYIEAHGTGTSLGDPIEIAGLTKAFDKYTNNMQFCAIGSVKSNIGHCESAAGIAGLTKILLQLKYKQLVPSLHSKQLNSNIDFIKTPFVVQQELASWERPIVKINGGSKQYKRRAGLSSFGAGGSNAHIIIEEYVSEVSREVENEMSNDKPVVIVLSAKSEEQLTKVTNNLLSFIDENLMNDNVLEALAYTLQVGREAMNERLALIVKSVDELKGKLKDISNKEYGVNTYRGQTKHNKETFHIFANDEDLQDVIDTWISKEKYENLLQLWVRGLNLDWNKLYTKKIPNRISLPTYPFAKERYWAVESRNVIVNSKEEEESRTKCFLQKQWEQTEIESSNEIVGTVVILVAEETFNLGKKVAQFFPKSEIVNSNDLSQFEMLDNWKEYKGFIDLIGCDSKRHESMDWILWLQKLIEHCSKESLMLLCVTKGLESFKNYETNLSGSTRVGLYRMLQSEYSNIRSRHMDADLLDSDDQLSYQIYSEYLSDNDDVEICYRKGKRFRAFLEERKEDNVKDNFMFPKEKVLWITGGTRGLGYLCAQHFIEHYGVKKLVLTGQEELPPKEKWEIFKNQNTALAEKIRSIQALEAKGVQVYARAVSFVNKNEMEECLLEVKEKMGDIGGVIHCAGITDHKNPAFIRKNLNDMRKVLNPKVDGLELLYQCFKNEPLKFMLVFSSVSAIIPLLGAGQTDYAMANAFMDYFAQAKNNKIPIISVQWPNWKQTGMGEIKSEVYKNTGLVSITDLEGLQLLDDILSNRMGPVVLPAIVNEQIWNPKQLMNSAHTEWNQNNILHKKDTTVIINNKDILLNLTMDWIRSLFSKELKIDVLKIEVDVPFLDYGLDSVLLTQILSQVNLVLEDELAPSTFYEYPTIQSLATELIKTHESILHNNLFQSNLKKDNFTVQKEAVFTPSIIEGELKQNDASQKTNQSTDIAVVGLSCRFPGANSIEEYWNLLAEGCSAIHKVPYDRWGYQSDYYAGLLDDISQFDSQFFHIHKEDAKQMDPQALMLLEESLKLWYQAGYNLNEIKGKAVGVYIGARSYRSDKVNIDETFNPSLVLGQNYLASNISNYFDLSGPSLVVDTACSSSLVAMNMAVQALQCGEIEAAIVGGISLLIDDKAHKTFKKRGILNKNGSFQIFDGRADGVVLGEGAGMVLLKREDRAIKDGDRIYSIIKGIAVNNDGRTAGPAAPNIERQKEVMKTALQRSGKDATDVQYIEANGSGSEVTDLLELKSIQSIYGETGKILGVGSVKPNIGHPLCAEGIASFIKTVLMIHNKQFAPFLSGEQPMKYFDINASRFHFHKQRTDWTNLTRIAAINCFGDGGTNCHVILESSKDTDSEKYKRSPMDTPKLNRTKMDQVNYTEVIQDHNSQEKLTANRKMFWQLFE